MNFHSTFKNCRRSSIIMGLRGLAILGRSWRWGVGGGGPCEETDSQKRCRRRFVPALSGQFVVEMCVPLSVALLHAARKEILNTVLYWRWYVTLSSERHACCRLDCSGIDVVTTTACLVHLLPFWSPRTGCVYVDGWTSFPRSLRTQPDDRYSLSAVVVTAPCWPESAIEKGLLPKSIQSSFVRDVCIMLLCKILPDLAILRLTMLCSVTALPTLHHTFYCTALPWTALHTTLQHEYSSY
jgi:hypothetical protein